MSDVYWYEPLNSDPDYGDQELPGLSECTRCGAVVRDESRHTAWHAGNDHGQGG